MEVALKKEVKLNEEKEEDIDLLIPITIDDAIFEWEGSKQFDIKSRFIGDFRGWENEARFEKALKELVEALNTNRIEGLPKSNYTK